MNQSPSPNKLINATSPYLKQHAHNPVQWYPWGKEALDKARTEDKPLIISIGYSACHWCHVMERESFENHEIAEVMNEGFVCIKVDREERPDIDQVYMEAIQTMGVNGGWPLNVFALPNQKPFCGGTYFQPRQWLHILKSIKQGYQEQRAELEESAQQFANALSISESQKYGLEYHGMKASSEDLKQMLNSMKQHFDVKLGGLKRAPKFPNPSIWKFLLIGNALVGDKDIHDQVMHTLEKMANGGIYDHVGGGFARYSVDEKWFAPHFEKMLYDNGQLISLYSMAHQVSENEHFREVVYDSIEFVERELTSPDDGFYSALDADSEGEEGNFYIWSASEIDDLLGEDASVFKEFYQVTPDGNWERSKNILHTETSARHFAKANDLNIEEFQTKIGHAKSILLQARSQRTRPGLDDKILAGWNGMMLRGLVDAYHAFGEQRFLDLALKNGRFISENLIKSGILQRSLREMIPGYLEDYALVIDAFLGLYQCTFDEKWLQLAKRLTDYTIENFYDPTEELFYFTDKNGEALIARKKEIFDNVIPASNSVMAQNLFWLGNLIELEDYLEKSRQMLSKISPMLNKEVQYLTNWGSLYAHYCQPIAEIAIIGQDYLSLSCEIQQHFIPNKMVVSALEESSLPMLRNRKPINDKTTIYVCFNKSCKMPVHSVKEALEQLDQ
jgi:uncharacterized protein YyaL (SSP411 family)